MNRIGIFGDSFATIEYTHQQKSSGGQISFSWPKLLETDYNFNVSYHAMHGTCLYWSYLEFLKNKTNYDVIIFATTEPYRLYTRDGLHIANLSSVEKKLETLSTMDPQYEYYMAAKYYYAYLMDDDFCIYIQDKIIQDIIKICNDEGKKLILLPVTKESVKWSTIFDDPLLSITQKEIYTQFNDLSNRLETHNRGCHMSKENNKILSGLLNDVLNGKQIKINVNNFEFKKVDDPETYWVTK